MKVIVFGATGTVGGHVVSRLCDEGHEVTAFSRRPGPATATPNLRHVNGDALDPDAVAAAVSGQDAVVITLGAGASRRSRVRSEGTLNVISAMHRHGVRRLVCQSTLGAHESWGNLDFFWKRVMFGALLRPVFLDHERQEQLVRASGLDWTIVRPSAFQDAPEAGDYIEDVAPTRRDLRLKIAIPDIAAFLARQLREDRYLHRAVGITT
jgi:uncharacterized protein YbjT (DUF2867 family)